MAGRLFTINPNGMFGASVSAVGPELAKKLNLEQGVLINDVPEGLRPEPGNFVSVEITEAHQYDLIGRILP